MIKKLNIGNIVLDNNLILAPMAGITDIAFRTICKEFGIGLVTTEMVSAKGLYYKDKKTEEYMRVNPQNRPVSLQIFGNEVDVMTEIVEKVLNNRDDFDIIDINMGCPAPKIVKNGDGSALMKDPVKAGRIVEGIKKVSNKPITVKFRSGWDSHDINAVEFAHVLENSGADMIAVHGRTREQFYSGRADYSIIKDVKSKVKIPVVGNGDVFSKEDAVRMFNETGCDGILLARGVLGNPWLIKNILEEYDKTKVYVPSPVERIEMLRKHAVLLGTYFSEKVTVLEMRKHAGWYIKGLPKSSDVRNKINSIESLEHLYDCLEEYIENLKSI